MRIPVRRGVAWHEYGLSSVYNQESEMFSNRSSAMLPTWLSYLKNSDSIVDWVQLQESPEFGQKPSLSSWERTIRQIGSSMNSPLTHQVDGILGGRDSWGTYMWSQEKPEEHSAKRSPVIPFSYHDMLVNDENQSVFYTNTGDKGTKTKWDISK